MSLTDALLLPDNLTWAWVKVRNFYRGLDGWIDDLALAEFELNLESELAAIRQQFHKQRYKTAPLRPLPQPKRKGDDGAPRTRQMFWVSVRDQVAWVAYLNAIGPAVDAVMPPWSYGNRLFRAVWFDESEHRPRLRIGPYRHTSGQLYRPFRQSWPVYRRHVYLTVKRMAGAKDRELSTLGEAESRIFTAEKDDLEDRHKLPYLRSGYWNAPIPEPYWAGMDLEKFYPNVKLATIKRTLRAELPGEEIVTGKLLDDLLSFQTTYEGFERAELGEVYPDEGNFPGLPTGLMVAGFLANVVLLNVDRAVAAQSKDRQIAHFRYVDDHLVLARTFDELQKWLTTYKDLLVQYDVGATFNPSKFEPPELGEYFRKATEPEVMERARSSCALDPRFPTPLMTQTLAKISEVTNTSADVLDDNEEEVLLNDLEHLMLADFPATELRPDTRVTFAAARMARIAAARRPPVRKLVDIRRAIEGLEVLLSKASPEEAKVIQQEMGTLRQRFRGELTLYRRLDTRSARRTFQLLMKALSEFPEKLRLWAQILRFSQESGYLDDSAIVDEIEQLDAAHAPTAAYVHASILHILSRQAISCARVICDTDALPHSRYTSWIHLKRILGGSVSHALGAKAHYYYVTRARLLFDAARGLAVAYVYQNLSPDLPPKWLTTLASIARRSTAWDWNTDLTGIHQQSGSAAPIWIWWAESLTGSSAKFEPGPAYRLQGPRLVATDSQSWRVWQLHPRMLPEQVDAVLRLGTNGLPEEANDLITQSKLQNTNLTEDGYLNLLEWVEWARTRRAVDPFDPREGEWTCLEIAAQIGQRIGKRSVDAIHPVNILVPREWVSDNIAPPWEVWRQKVMKSRLRIAKKPLRGVPFRVPFMAPTELRDFERVSATAIILLGLLRKDFRWPAFWNIPVHRLSRGGLIRGFLGSTQCSSWTAAILEGCLTPRQRETLFWPLFGFGNFGAEDTTDDPPTFATLTDLVLGIRHAQSVLKEYQLSVKDYKARQMVPVCLTQLTRRTWSAVDIGGENG